MDGERAETFLRLLAEAGLRDQLGSDPPPWAGGPGAGRLKVSVVGEALTAVGALERETVAEVLAEFDLAAGLRRLHNPGPAGRYPSGTTRAPSAPRLAGPLPARAPRAVAVPASAGGRGGGRRRAAAERAITGASGPPPPDHDQGPEAADRFVPIGRTLPFHAGGLSGELYLLSYARTGAGARLIVSWGTPALSPGHELGLQQAELRPGTLLAVTDDRGAVYELGFTDTDGSGWVSQVSLHPAPPDGVRWLEVAAPPGPPVRVNLHPADGPPAGEPETSPANLSAGERLLTMLAEELLVVAAPFPLAPPPAFAPRAVQAMGAGLGDIIAGLEAVDQLPPLSPVPARLAALCASLGISGHGIAAAPARDLPEPWLSVLTYYQRRKSDTTQVRDGFAAATAALPELDGIRLALVGLHNTQGTTRLQVLARGLRREERRGPHGINLDFPLSLWLRDSGGRWHAARPADWHPAGTASEHSVGLMLVPPLPRSTAWVEVRAGGRSGSVRARLQLHWGAPVLTGQPNGAWFHSLPPCETYLPCGTDRHIVRWEAGQLRLPSHPDPEGELILAALGGEKTRCVEVTQTWERYAADLSVLTVGPRGPADEIAVSWDDVDAAARRSQAGGWTAYAPRTGGLYPGTGSVTPPLPARYRQAMQDRELAARRRSDMLSLLALGYGFQVRLIGQVAETFSGQRQEPGEKVRPSLVAAITARLAPVAEEWLGIDPGQVVVTLHHGPGWGSAALTGRGEQRRLRVSLQAGWLAWVWAAGLALTGRHLVVAVARAGWPEARVLALRAPGTEPVPLDVHTTTPGPASAGLDAWLAADDAPHWEI